MSRIEFQFRDLKLFRSPISLIIIPFHMHKLSNRIRHTCCIRWLSQALPVADESLYTSQNGTIKKMSAKAPTLTSPFAPISFNKRVQVAMSDHDESRIDALLSSEQKALVQKMHDGHNIYFTGIMHLNSWLIGKAGTGKSLVIQKFVSEFKKHSPAKNLAVVVIFNS